MWKKIVGIIGLSVGGILMMIYVVNWVIDDPYDLHEATINLQRNYIETKEVYISQCEDAIDEVYDYQWIYGWDYTTEALIESYEDLIFEAEWDIKEARNIIFKAQNEIETLRSTALAIILIGVTFIVTGLILLISYIKNRDVKVQEIEGEEWICAKCGKSNSILFNECECGASKY